MSTMKFDHVHVAESGQAVVASGRFGEGFHPELIRGDVSATEFEPGVWWVNRAIIQPESARGQGLGTQLLQLLLERLAEKATFKELLVQPGGYNLPVRRQRQFYKQVGFKSMRKLPGVLRWTKQEMHHEQASVG